MPVDQGGREPEATGLPGWATALIVLLILAVVGVGVAAYFIRRRVAKLEDYRALPEDGSAPTGRRGARGGRQVDDDIDDSVL